MREFRWVLVLLVLSAVGVNAWWRMASPPQLPDWLPQEGADVDTSDLWRARFTTGSPRLTIQGFAPYQRVERLDGLGAPGSVQVLVEHSIGEVRGYGADLRSPCVVVHLPGDEIRLIQELEGSSLELDGVPFLWRGMSRVQVERRLGPGEATNHQSGPEEHIEYPRKGIGVVYQDERVVSLWIGWRPPYWNYGVASSPSPTAP